MNSDLLHVILGALVAYGILRFFTVKETLNTLLNNSKTSSKILDLEAKRRNLQAQETEEALKQQVLEQAKQKAQDAPVQSSDFDKPSA